MCTITFELDLPADEDKRMEAEDGTTFFRSRSALYTSVEGARIEVLLPTGFRLEPRGSVGNSLYFYAKGESTHVFFKSSLSSDKLTIDRVNELSFSDEIGIFPEQPFYSVRRDNQLTVYRFEENEKAVEGRSFDISGSDPAATSYRLLWRGKLILTQMWQSAEITQLSENVILLRIPSHLMGSFIHDSCDLLYLLYHSKRFFLLVDPVNLAIHRVENAYNPPQQNNAAFGFVQADIVSVRGDTILYTTGPVMEPRQNWRGRK